MAENGKDREWQNHKWVNRKRDKDGKWIYDYGDGKSFAEDKTDRLKEAASKVGSGVAQALWDSKAPDTIDRPNRAEALHNDRQSIMDAGKEFIDILLEEDPKYK